MLGPMLLFPTSGGQQAVMAKTELTFRSQHWPADRAGYGLVGLKLKKQRLRCLEVP